MLGVSVPTLDLLIRDRRLTVRQVGFWRRLKRSEIEALHRDSITPAL
jgi:hypothetical protein